MNTWTGPGCGRSAKCGGGWNRRGACLPDALRYHQPGEGDRAGETLEYVRGHWGIENRLHYVRDVTLGEDASQVRTGAAPQVWRHCATWSWDCCGAVARDQHRGGNTAHRLDAGPSLSLSLAWHEPLKTERPWSYTDEGLKSGTLYAYRLTNVIKIQTADVPPSRTEVTRYGPAITMVRTALPTQSPWIISGSNHVCILDESGSAYCWGLDDYGQATPPQDVVFASLSTGSLHTCGLTPDGSPVCWGRNENGESEPPIGETFVAISSGSGHTCALREDGTPVCWGKNTDRYGNTVGQATPPEGETFSIISSGGDHTCGIQTDDTMRCWGWTPLVKHRLRTTTTSGTSVPEVGGTPVR